MPKMTNTSTEIDKSVVITGVGIVSPLGLNSTTHYSNLLNGKSAVNGNTEEFNFPTIYPCAKVSGFDARQMIPNRSLRKLLAPTAKYAMVAAGEAIENAGLSDETTLLNEAGIYVGSLALDVQMNKFAAALFECIEDDTFDYSAFGKRGMNLIDPLFLVKGLPNSAICGVAIEHQINGPNLNITNGPVSGLQAIATAASAIRKGLIDIAVVGAYDSLLNAESLAANIIDDRLSSNTEHPESACRPFSTDRNGFAPSEGAAFVILESRTSALKRTAPILASIRGIGEATDTSALLNGSSNTPDHSDRALFNATSKALQRASMKFSDVDVIYGTGLATVKDDMREIHTVRELDHGDSALQYTAATGALGFAGAASGIQSFAHACLGLKQQVVPPLVNCTNPLEELPFNVSAEVLNLDCSTALVWNSDYGYKHAAIVIASER